METSTSLAEQLRALLLSLVNLLRAVVDELATRAGEYGARAGRSAGLFTAAMACLVLGLVYVSIGLIVWLSSLLSPAGAYLIVGGVLLAGAAGLLYAAFGKRKGGLGGSAEDKAPEDPNTPCSDA